MADVPDDKTATDFTLLYAASSSSKPFTLFPKGAIQFNSNASSMYFISSPLICGEDRKILSLCGTQSLLDYFSWYTDYSYVIRYIFCYDRSSANFTFRTNFFPRYNSACRT